MLGKSDTYKKKDRLVLAVGSGPAGWATAFWSIFLKNSSKDHAEAAEIDYKHYYLQIDYELSVNVHCSGGMVAIGKHSHTHTFTDAAISLDAQCANFLDEALDFPKHIIWHPSGERLLIIDRGCLTVFALRWVDRKTCAEVSMMTACRLHEDSGNGDSSTSLPFDLIALKIQKIRALHCQASSIDAFDMGRYVLLGDTAGRLRRISWDGELLDAEEQQISCPFDRSLLRLWEPHTRLNFVHKVQADSIAKDDAGSEDVENIDEKLTKQRLFQEETIASAAINEEGDDVCERKITEQHILRHADRSISDSSAPYWTPAMMHAVRWSERTHVLISLFADGSITFSNLAHARSGAVHVSLHPSLLSVSTSRIHPVALVAYPVDTERDGDIKATESKPNVKPSIYEMSSTGRYRSPNYVTPFDVESTLNLTPSLLAKVCRMRRLVSGCYQEELSKVIAMEIVDDADLNGGNSHNPKLSILLLMQTKHLPLDSDNDKGISLHTNDEQRNIAISTTASSKESRFQSMSIVKVDVICEPRHDSGILVSPTTSLAATYQSLSFKCAQSILLCCKKSIESSSPSIKLLRSNRSIDALVLINCDGEITGRSLLTMNSVVFRIVMKENVASPLQAPSSELRFSYERWKHWLTLSTGMNRIVIANFVYPHLNAAESDGELNNIDNADQVNEQFLLNPLTSVHIINFNTLVTARMTKQSESVFVDIVTGVFSQLLMQDTNMQFSSYGVLLGPRMKRNDGISSNGFDDSDGKSSAALKTAVAAATSSNVPASKSIVGAIDQALKPLIQMREDDAAAETLVELSMSRGTLPSALIADAKQYLLQCAMLNPFQPRRSYHPMQGGLLIANSQQCQVSIISRDNASSQRNYHHEFDSPRGREENDIHNGRGSMNINCEAMYDKKELMGSGFTGATAKNCLSPSKYLAFIAGGNLLPCKNRLCDFSKPLMGHPNLMDSYRQAKEKSRVSKGRLEMTADKVSASTLRPPVLWVYNPTTKRWRRIFLFAGNRASKAALIKDIPSASALYSAHVDYERDACKQRRKSRDLSVNSRTNSGDAQSRPSSIRSLSSVLTEPKHNDKSTSINFPKDGTGGVLDMIFGNQTLRKKGSTPLASSSASTSLHKISDESTKLIVGREPVIARAASVDSGSPTCSKSPNLSRSEYSIHAQPADGEITARSQPRKTQSAYHVLEANEAKIRLSRSNDSNNNGETAAAAVDAAKALGFNNSFQSCSVPITRNAHLAGNPYAVIGLSWFEHHTILITTMRRSLFCLELISREPSKESFESGKPQAAVHRIILLPPGYFPRYTDVVVIRLDRGQFVQHNGEGLVDSEIAGDNSSFDSDLESSDDEDLDSEHEDHVSCDADEGSVHFTDTGDEHKTGSVNCTHASKPSLATLKRLATSVNLDYGAASLVSDGKTCLCYFINPKVDPKAAVPVGSNGVSYMKSPFSSANIYKGTSREAKESVVGQAEKDCSIKDYAVTELWDVAWENLQFVEHMFNSRNSQSSDCFGDAGRSSVESEEKATSQQHNTTRIEFPLLDMKLYPQNVPVIEQQKVLFKNLRRRQSAGYPSFPIVSVLLLDSAGKVIFVEPHLKLFGILDSGPVNHIDMIPQEELLQRWGAGVEEVENDLSAANNNALVDSSHNKDLFDGSPIHHFLPSSRLVLNDALLFQSIEDHHATAYISLMEIFRRTTLLKYYSRDGQGDLNPKFSNGEKDELQRNEIVGGAGGGSKLLLSFLWHESNESGVGHERHSHDKGIHPLTQNDFKLQGNSIENQLAIDREAVYTNRGSINTLGTIAVRVPAIRSNSRYIGVQNGVMVSVHDNSTELTLKSRVKSNGQLQLIFGPSVYNGTDQTVVCSRFSLSYYIFRGFYSDFLPMASGNRVKKGIIQDDRDAQLNGSEQSLLYMPKIKIRLGSPAHGSSANYSKRGVVASSVMRVLIFKVLAAAVRRSSDTAYFLSHLEFEVKKLTESDSFDSSMHQYSSFTSFLYRFEPLLLTELMSRLGRKLEPSVSKKLFPVHLGCFQDMLCTPHRQITSLPQGQSHHEQERKELIHRSIDAGVIALFESALQSCNLNHAARLLSLACESLGGSDDHISTVASLVLALELLHHCLIDISARNALECFDFCMRLEAMLAMHSKVIFGSNAFDHLQSSNSAQDMAYINSVKGRALLLIRKERGLSTITTPRQGHSSNATDDANQEMLFTPMASASPALPFYIGAGVGWVVSRAIQALQSTPSEALPKHSSNQSQVKERDGLYGTWIKSTASNIDGNDEVKQQRDLGNSERQTKRIDTAGALLAAAMQTGHYGGSYRYRAIDILERECGSDMLNSMLSFTNAKREVIEDGGGNRKEESFCRSPTIQLLVFSLKEFFQSSSHYCNIAVLMASILQSGMRDDVCRQILMDFIDNTISDSTSENLHLQDNEAGNESEESWTPEEKIRRIFFALRLTKAVARGENLSFRLFQSVSPQYLRRVIEADMVKSSSNGNSIIDTSCHTLDTVHHPRATSGSTSIRSNYFELPEELVRGADIFSSEILNNHGNGIDRSMDTGPLCILSLLRALFIALLLVKDYDTAHLLLLSIGPSFTKLKESNDNEQNDDRDEMMQRLEAEPLKQWTVDQIRQLLQRLKCI